MYEHGSVNSSRRIGEVYALGGSAIWGFFPIVTQLSLNTIPPLWGAGLSALLAVPFFAALVSFRGEWGQLRDRRAWRGILMVTILIGVIFYGLNFIGFQHTSAGNGSIILMMELFFTMGILRWWGGEYLSPAQVVGAILMLVGAVLVLFQGTFVPQKGDLLLLAATVFPPLGNFYAREARQFVSSSVVLFCRSVLSAGFLLLAALCVNGVPLIGDLQHSFPYLLINGFVLFGLSKLLWLETIHRIEISVGLALGAVTPAFTLLYANLILGDIPTAFQLWGLLPTMAGIVLLTGVLRRKISVA